MLYKKIYIYTLMRACQSCHLSYSFRNALIGNSAERITWHHWPLYWICFVLYNLAWLLCYSYVYGECEYCMFFNANGLSAVDSLSLTPHVLLLLLQAFVDFFSQALEWEYRGSGITVQTITPGYVSTNMLKFSELVHRPGMYSTVLLHTHFYTQTFDVKNKVKYCN